MQNILENNKLVFSFPEKLDTVYCSKIESELVKKIMDEKKEVIFDLEGVEYICSLFLRICVKVTKEIGKDNFSIKNVGPSTLKVFKIARFDELVLIQNK